MNLLPCKFILFSNKSYIYIIKYLPSGLVNSTHSNGGSGSTCLSDFFSKMYQVIVIGSKKKYVPDDLFGNFGENLTTEGL